MSRRKLRRILQVMAAVVAGLAIGVVLYCYCAGSDEARIRRLIPRAASMPISTWNRIVSDAGTMNCRHPLTLEECEDQNLSALLILGRYGDAPGEVSCRDLALIGRPNPADLFDAVERRWLASAIHAEDISGYSCDVSGASAHGRLAFNFGFMVRGRLEFSAEKSWSGWTITEFRLAASKLAVRLGADGLWKLHKPE